MRRWREANKDQRAEYRDEYRANNPDKTKADNDRFRGANREKRAAQTAEYRKANPGQNRAAVARWRAAVLRATPAWADQDAITAVYVEAARLTDEQGRVYHVDHIVPLRGENVCGLHVAWNLQPLPASENCRKSNRFDEAACAL